MEAPKTLMSRDKQSRVLEKLAHCCEGDCEDDGPEGQQGSVPHSSEAARQKGAVDAENLGKTPA